MTRKNGRARQDIGIFFLSVTGAFSLWSATNTSYTGHMAFGLKDPQSAKTAMNLGVLFIAVQAAALLFLYGKRAYAAAGGAMLTGAVLYGIYDHALKNAAQPEPASAGYLPPRSAGAFAGAQKAPCACAKT
jgi:hypothetical protein